MTNTASKNSSVDTSGAAGQARKTGAAYIRVSTDDQAELSPDAQKRLILDYGKKNFIDIPSDYIFVENGISGKKADKRPEFLRMIAMAKSPEHPFDVILVWKFSRFARNQEESIVYKSMLKKDQVDVLSISEPLIGGPFGSLIERIIEWMDEYYSVNLSGEVIRGMTEKALRSGYQIPPCLGYRAAGKGEPYKIDPQEYEIVEFIHQSYHKGKDIRAIAREANQLGYRTKRDHPFDTRAVYRILNNHFYAGAVSWNNIKFHGSHECRKSILDIFEDNQNRLRREYRPAGRREVSSCRHWMSGLLKCAVCGGSLSYHASGKSGQSAYFQCWKYCKGLHEGSCSVTEKKVLEAVLKSLRHVLSSCHMEYEYRKLEQDNSRHTDAVREAVKKNEFKERRARDAYENGIDTLEEYRENKMRLLEERRLLLACLDMRDPWGTEQHTACRTDVMHRIKSIYDLIETPDVPYEIKGNALRCILKKVVFDRTENEFHFFYYT